MKPLIAKWALLLFIVVAPSICYGKDAPKKVYSDDELVEILTDEGYRAVEILQERVIQLKVDGRVYALYVYDDGDLQLYFGLTGYSVDVGDINEWNRSKRLCAPTLILMMIRWSSPICWPTRVTPAISLQSGSAYSTTLRAAFVAFSTRNAPKTSAFGF